LTTTGDFTVRVTADVEESHGLGTDGSNVSPLGSTILTGIRNVLIVVEGVDRATNGFFPTIVYLNVLLPSLTVAVNLFTDVDAVANACD
jgi:hypothetical protein